MKNSYFKFLVWSVFFLTVNACFLGCTTAKTIKPLLSSAALGDFEAVKVALEVGANVNAKSKLGSTPLHYASNNGHENIVRLLLGNSADVSIISGGGLTAFHYAALGGYKNIAQLLLDNGADINEKSNNGSTPLHYAARTDHVVFTLFLLAKGADVHAKDDLGQTALHDAANGGSPEIVLSLIGAGAEIDIADNDSNTPLFLARKNENLQSIQILENEYSARGISMNYTKPLIVKKDSLNPNNTPAKNNKQQNLGKLAESAVAQFTPLKTNMSNPDGIAVIVGTKSYNHKDIPDVLYAKNDADAMRMFLINSLGYKDGNIIFNVDPTKADLEMLFGIKGNHKGTLYDYIKPNKSDVFIYYSGHGAPDVNTNKAYLVPNNGHPNKIAFTGYPLDTFYENISLLQAKRMTVVIESCFSGGTDSGKWIVSNASPALIKITNPVVAKQNIAILTSSEISQISSWYPAKKHGLFTYFFLQAVSGEADKDKNNKITLKEIYNYVSDRTEGVPYWAKRLHGGRVQIPTLQILNEEEVFVGY